MSSAMSKKLPPQWWFYFIPLYLLVMMVLFSLVSALIHGELPAWYK